ncbi:MAG TPA: hypothetical protein VF729_09055, partial [Solirubrobacterales bacterium]
MEVLADGQLVPDHRDLHQGALARPVLADEADQLPRADFEIGALQGLDGTAPQRYAAMKALPQPPDPQHRLSNGIGPRGGSTHAFWKSLPLDLQWSGALGKP